MFTINTIKEDNSSNSNLKKNSKKKDGLNNQDDEKKLNLSNEDNNIPAESNDYLNDRSNFSPTRAKKKYIK